MKNNSDALNALYTLAQCAVAVYSHVQEKFEYRELINSSDILKRTFKKNAYLKIHFGIWFLMCMTLLIQIISIFFLKQIGV